MERIRNLPRLSIFFILTALGAAFFLTPRSQAQADALLREAWQSTERAGEYSFESRVTQTVLPAARLTAVGQPARVDTLFVEGMSDRSAETLTLTLWNDPSTIRQKSQAIEVKIEGAQAFGRTSSTQAWQQIDDFSGSFAPSGDAAAFLAAAQNVVPLGQATSDVPNGDGTLRSLAYDRYRFTLDGDAYAEQMRATFQAQLREAGKLPPGVTLSASDTYRQMVAQGEAWIGGDGLPLRIEMTMDYPVQRNGERVTVDVVTTFTGFEGSRTGLFGITCFENCLSRNVGEIWDNFSERATNWANTSHLYEHLTVITFALLLTVALLRFNPRKSQTAVAATLSLQMAFAPLGSVIDAQALREFGEQYNYLMPEAESETPQLPAAVEPIFDTTTSPLDAGQQQVERAKDAEKVLETGRSVSADGPDADSDGLEDALEGPWFTDEDEADSDDDGLSDGLEVATCPERSAWFAGDNQGNPSCADPYYADSDLDGLNDMEEVKYLGTYPQMKDTDGDGITDGAEVQGFLMPTGSQRRYPDPHNADSNRDGLTDGIECPTLRRTEITDDYRGATSGNSPWNATLRCEDTDGDGEPDIFDYDNDGDGVPDSVDAAPFVAFGSGAPFDRGNAMQLELKNLAQGEPVMVDLQIRPNIPEHLSYALNVLDWPTGDSEGQIQRLNHDSFGTVDGSLPSSIDIFDNIDRKYYGDMRLTPMLEITLPGNTLDLPRVAPYSELSLTQQGRFVGAFELTPNGEAMTMTVSTLGDATSGTLSIGTGSCDDNTLVWAQPVVEEDDAIAIAARLGDYANGGHVMTFVQNAKLYCEPIPSLVEGTRTLTVYLQEPPEPFGTLYQSQFGNDVNFYFDLENPTASYDVQILEGGCSASPVVAELLSDIPHEQPITLQNFSQLTDVANGERAMRVVENGQAVLCSPLGNIVNGSQTTMIDPVALDAFQISVSENADGTLSAMVPLSMAVDPLTGKTEAFNGRMFYQRSTTGTLNHTVNLLWVVTMLTDTCPNGDCANPFAIENQLRIVHTYRDEAWFLTGLDVTEELGIDGAIVFEDPATETDTVEEREANLVEWDDSLWHLANGLNRIFVEGVDCDSADGETCAATTDNQRDLQVGDINTRWGSGSSANNTERWDIPADALRVTEFSRQHPGAMGDVMSFTIPNLLNTHFGDGTFPFTSTLGSPTTQVYPTFLVATEQTYRTVGIESAENTTTTTNKVTLDFNPNTTTNHIEPVTATALSWKPFQHVNGAWEAMPIDQYWDRLESLLPTSAEYQAGGDLESEYEAAADIRFTQVAYLTLYSGLGNIVEVTNNGATVNTWALEEIDPVTDKHIETISSVVNATGSIKGSLTKAFLKPMYEVLDFEFSIYKRLQAANNQRMINQLQFTYKGAVGRAIKHAGLKITGWERLTNGSKNVTLTGKARAAGGAFTSTAAMLLIGTSRSIASMSNDKNNTTQQAVISTLQGIGTAQSIGNNLKTVDTFFKFKAKLGTNAKAFKALTNSLKASKAAKVVAIVGLIIEVGIAVGVFIFQMVSAGVEAFSLVFNAAAAGVVANTIVAVLLAALASTGIGAIIVAIIGLIDSVINLICQIAQPAEDNEAAQWVCKGLTGLAAELVAYLIYDATDIVDINNPQRMQITQFNPYLITPENGFVSGAQLGFDMRVQNTIETQSFDSPLSLTYGWQFNESNTRSTTFSYYLVNQPDSLPLLDDLSLDGHPAGWQSLGDDRYRQTFTPFPLLGNLQLPTPGINADIPAYLAEGYASPTQECFVVPVPPLFVPVPVCHVRSRNASHYLNLQLVFDVFPATLDDFYDLEATSLGYRLAWGGDELFNFPTLVDADGDGLHRGIDPDDSNADSDGDGIADLREMQIGTDPMLGNSDGDNLSDLEELRFGSNPLRTDTDQDGLRDDEEWDGWSIGYNVVNGQPKLSWAYSDPLVADADDDNLFDRVEKARGFSPRASSDPTVMRHELDLRETDATQLVLQLDEEANATTFVDSSSPDTIRSAECSADQCPISGMPGLSVNAAYFDGSDVLTLGYNPDINLLTNNFTVAAWVKPDNLSGRRRIVSTSRTNGADGFGFGINNGNLLFTAYGRVDFNGTAASEIELGEWSHVAAVVEAVGGQTRVSFYVNGELTESVTHNISGLNPSASNDTLIGSAMTVRTIDLEESFVGYLDEVVIYDRALDGNGVFETLYTLYNFDDEIVTTDADLVLQTELESKLLVRNIEGVLQTELPPFLDGGFAPRNFNLAPRASLPVETQTLSFNTIPASGQYVITQTASGVVDVQPQEVLDQEDSLEYHKESADSYNGTSDYYSVPSSSRYNLNNTDFTISLWVQQLPFGTERRGVFGYRSGQDDGYPSVQIIGTTIYFGYGTGSNWEMQQLNSALPFDGKWHHVVISFDRVNGVNNSVATVYVDDVNKGSLNFGSARPNSAYQQFDIGRSSQTAEFRFNKFDLECEADGPGDGEYTINYWTTKDYEDHLYWADSGTNPKNFTSINSVGWREFEGSAYVSICEDDGYDQTTCESNDERMKRNAAESYIIFRTTQESYTQSSDVEFSTTPTDPTCGFWTGYDDIAQLRWEFRNDSLPYDGSIKDVRLYSRTFAAGDIDQLYASDVEISRFKLDERPGAVLFNDDNSLTVGECDDDAGQCPVTGLLGRETVAVHFDGVNDYISADEVSGLARESADNPSIHENGVSFGGWFKPDMDFPSFDTEPYILGFHDSGGGNRILLGLIAEGSDRFKVRVYDGATAVSTISNNSFARDEWHHITFSVNYLVDNQPNAELVVNNQREAFFTLNTKPTSDGRFVIGMDWDSNTPTDHYKGMMDEIFVMRDAIGWNGAYGEELRLPTTMYHMEDATEFSFSSGVQEAVGKVYGAIDFDGNDSAFGQFVRNEFGFMAWLYPRNMTGNGSPTYRTLGGFTLNPQTWIGLVDGVPTFFDNPGNSIASSLPLPPEQWSHVAFMREGGLIKIYVNGALAASGASSGTYDTRRLDLGSGNLPNGGTTYYYDGLMDEVAFYHSIVPDDEQIAGIYNFQTSWIDEQRAAAFTVDRDEPTVIFTQEDEYIGQTPQRILLDSADSTSYVASVLMIYGDPTNNDSGFAFATPCDDAVSGQAFCALFSPQLEGAYEFEVGAIDAVGNISEDASNKTLYVDGSGPALTLNALPASPFAATLVESGTQTRDAKWKISLSGTAIDPQLSDGNPGVGLERVQVIIWNGNDVYAGTPGEQNVVLNGNNWTLDYTLIADNPSGEYYGVVFAVDKVGNESILPIAPFIVENTAPESNGSVDGPQASTRSGDALTLYLNANSTVDGTVTERPESAETLPSVAGLASVDVAFDPIYGSTFVNTQLPLDALLYMPFDEAYASENDQNNSFTDLVAGATATCSGTACPAAAVSTRTQQGVHFDGVNDELTLGVLPGITDLTDNFAVGAWIKLDDTSGVQRIVSTGRSASANNGWGFGLVNGGLRFTTYGVLDYDSTLITLDPNVWYFVEARLSDGDVSFFVNAEFIETVTHTTGAIANTDDGLLIGAKNGGAPERFNGTIDSLFIVDISVSSLSQDHLFGDAPTLHLPFDTSATEELGGMGATVVVTGSQTTVAGVEGAHALPFGTGQISELAVTTGDGVLVNPFDAWTLSFWMRDMGEGAIVFKPEPNDVALLTLGYSGSADAFTYSDLDISYAIPLNDTSGVHHYTFVWEFGTLAVYQDGELLQEDFPDLAIPIALNQMTIGGDGTPFVLDDLRVYQRLLSVEEIAALAHTNWLPADLTSRSTTDADWSADVPDGLEGFYSVRSRGTDVLGNFDADAPPIWSGLVDTLAPRITYFDTQDLGGGQTQYDFTIEDFNIDPTTFSVPAACTLYLYDRPFESAWYLALNNQAGEDVSRATISDVACLTDAPLVPTAAFTFCDTMGNCTTVDAGGNAVPTAVGLLNVTAATGTAWLWLALTVLLACAAWIFRRSRSLDSL